MELIEVDLLGPSVSWQGAADVHHCEAGVTASRLPLDRLHLFDFDLAQRAAIPVGVRLTVATDSPVVVLDLNSTAETDVTLDMVVNGGPVETRTFPGQGLTQLRFDELPRGKKRIEFYLPTKGRTYVSALRVSRQASCRPWNAQWPRWITYGSSITQCMRAITPTRTWPSIVARHFNWHQTNLGFSGQCFFDPLVAMHIGTLPADIISLCLGINTHGNAFSPRTWRSTAMGFIQIVRQSHPHVPLMILSPICSPQREQTSGQTGLTLVMMRQWLKEMVELLQRHGDKQIHYIDGLSILGHDDVHLMSDGLHPDGPGIEVQGRRMVDAFSQMLPHTAAPVSLSV